MLGHLQKYNKYCLGQCGFNPVFRVIENDNYYIELIETFNCDSKEEVIKIQNEIIETMDCLK